MIKIRFLLPLCSIVLLSSCVSRLARPAISGVIVDYDKNPVADCRVGETVTDKNGAFYLKEKRYNKFLLSEMMIMEAPPLRVEEPIVKADFISDAITLYNPRGGGQAKGAKYQIDTIFLKRTNQEFDIADLLANKHWNLSYTKNADTIYMLRSGFAEWCKTEKCRKFFNEYEALTDNYYHSYRKNLSEGVIKRFIELKFKGDHSGRLEQVQHYKHTFEGPNKQSDTLKTSFNWALTNKGIIQFKVPEPVEISHSYKVAWVDLYQLMLVKTKYDNLNNR
ncbi:hypothetical protein OQX61_23545 [Pedobacter sp. PLR]|uniref:hypothetical protein n=1 Tax=Pedobacter sp. PLR TaxID=2994465 RepID=UPI002245D300|nr:hypothetical protein [Pedobacter sp. PLR]MCX2454266.1 hypothetical protein [Pedobacter sp. PLR]